MDTGPALPPHLAKKLNTDRKEKNENEEKQSCTDMSTKQQGEKSSSAHSEDSADSDECESYGPALPPGFQKRKENVPSRTRVLGPMRPAQFDYPRTVASSASENNVSSDDDDDDEDMIGPTPPAAADINAEFERTKMDIEVRSKAKKDQMTGKKDVKPKRETWMTELPPDLSKNFGLGPRTFRARAVELGDQSVWTDTPEDKDKKSKEGDRGSKRGADNDEAVSRTPWELARDQQMTSQVEHYNSTSKQNKTT
ncbi:GPALPP motif-containing protein 1 [Desmophyllum pertusum]|uniref:GPALPP motif-containing protein 1 n=1 Tax=Desmophyllum pertusum TaxID=174260 RepID=A0A9X0DBL0_9CNID|nr:GPALPP motif-containing protein 1 [Desmophyllum pertusum]